jgi:hypothetical protein
LIFFIITNNKDTPIPEKNQSAFSFIQSKIADAIARTSAQHTIFQTLPFPIIFNIYLNIKSTIYRTFASHYIITGKQMQRKPKAVQRTIRYIRIRLFRKIKHALRLDRQQDLNPDFLFVQTSIHFDMLHEPSVQKLLKNGTATIAVPGFLSTVTLLPEKSKGGRIGTQEWFLGGKSVSRTELWLKTKRVSTKYIEFRSLSPSVPTASLNAPDNNHRT